jgi:KaiC/GvpD/RAD55 family RecA-like ATPase
MSVKYTSLGGGNNGTGQVNISTGGLTISSSNGSATLLVDMDNEKVDLTKQIKMFMWYMQAYHPEAIEEFNAVEDIKRKI